MHESYRQDIQSGPETIHQEETHSDYGIQDVTKIEAVHQRLLKGYRYATYHFHQAKAEKFDMENMG